MSQRVFITGVSAVSAAGMTLDDTWQAVLNAKTGIAPITQWDSADWQFPLGGELKEFKPRTMVKDKKLLKLMSRHDVVGLNAVTQAVEDSGLIPFRDSLDNQENYNDKTGVYVGSPGNKFFQQYDFLPLLAESNGDMKAFADHLFEQVHPMWLLKILPNNVLAYAGIQYGFKGPNQNVTNHVVSGLQAIIEAYYAVSTGQAERAVVVAYDMGYEAEALLSYAKLGIISPDGLRPFDCSHNGTVMAEGAAALVLESERSVKERGARSYGEVLGGMSSSDAQGIFSLDDDAEQLSRLMDNLLSRTQLTAADLGMVTAHANGNTRSDISEAKALARVLPNVPVTGFKWATGHTLCASGVMDTVLTLKSFAEQCVPGIANFKSPAEGCEVLSISAKHRPLKSKTAMILSRGFGGMNTGLMVQHCE